MIPRTGRWLPASGRGRWVIASAGDTRGSRGVGRLGVWIAVAGGAGYVPRAPGTAGAAVGVVLFAALAPLGLPLLLLTTAALWALGVWASDCAEAHFGQHDDGRIVIDEVVGQWIALLPLLGMSRELVLGSATGIAGLVTGFVAFRVFDIWKPGPVGWAERRFAGGAGVMADDVVAGGLAALLLAALLQAGLAGGVA